MLEEFPFGECERCYYYLLKFLDCFYIKLISLDSFIEICYVLDFEQILVYYSIGVVPAVTHLGEGFHQKQKFLLFCLN